MSQILIPPYGGKLVQLIVDDSERPELQARAGELKSIQLSAASLSDLELLACGAFSPLDRFLSERDYLRVRDEMRLADGTLFPIPVTLPIPDGIQSGEEITLRNSRNELMAVMRVEEIFPWDREAEMVRVYGNRDAAGPIPGGTNRLASGPLLVLQLPAYRDFPGLRRTPHAVRAQLTAIGSANVAAYHTRQPIHRAQEEQLKRAAVGIAGSLLIHPAAGAGKPGDVEHYARVRSYRAVVDRYFDPRSTLLSLLPLTNRPAGDRELLFHAIIRRNFGANHLIVHSAEAQQTLERHSQETGVRPVYSPELMYLEAEGRFEEAAAVPQSAAVLSLHSRSVTYDYLGKGTPLPEWFTRPEVSSILSRAFPPRHEQGFCLWATGLPSSGKSTISDILSVLLMERGRQVTVLDGDTVRTHLSKGLGFTRADRDTNILRIGFVASEIVRHGGAVICAAVSPYRATRNQVRDMVGPERFITMFVNTPLSECERRDVKGLYARARAGELKDFTGVDDPYEPPENPEITLTTIGHAPEEDARRVCDYLEERGFLLSAARH